MKVSEYVGNATMLVWCYCCILFSSRVTARVRVRFSVRLVNGYAHVFVQVSIV